MLLPRVPLLVRALLNLLLLPGVVAFVVPLASVAAPRAPHHPAGLVMVIVGAALLLWCVTTFFTQGRGTLAPWDPPRELVTVGPYRITRNPMYIAVLLIVSGWSVTYASRGLLAYGVLLIVLFQLRVRLAEEPWAARTFGASWSRYTARVPRWLWRERP